MEDIQFDWDGAAWQRSEVGSEPEGFALGVMDEFAYIAATGSEGDEEFFTLGSNPGLAFGDPEWLFAQDNPAYVVECLGLPADREPAVTKVVDKYLSRLDDTDARGEPAEILSALVSAMGLPPLPR
ncbi:hypothetical protein CFAEC_10015 [Corynebacterium faecale]|uniref:hypothetical protein n=1 Tax=Corynebacterium faecale TaxID=1758466 RepID=UPI0025B318AB|nr:hypothetical protein [Corynebacterium faecale]WJY92816.1 hypothetical protein CFAEC_10015 [Corynebacterium faecale]